MGTIYCWFESLFGQNLGEYLWGYNCETQDYSNANLFNTIGLLTLGVSLVFVLAYYYLPLYLFNHPHSSKWWNWLIILLIAGVVNLLIGYAWTVNALLDGNIGDCMMYTKDENGNILSQLVDKSDCWLFGLANFFISTMSFIVWSFAFKWKSRNCKHSPCF